MKNTISFVIFVLVVVGFLFAISGKRQPRIPNTEYHKGITDTAVCLGCHGPDGKKPIKQGHPPKDQCFECHKRRLGSNG